MRLVTPYMQLVDEDEVAIDAQPGKSYEVLGQTIVIEDEGKVIQIYKVREMAE